MLSISTTLSGVISHAELFLLSSCGTLEFRGTPVENHWAKSIENSKIRPLTRSETPQPINIKFENR